jgi:hypothetical protein
MDCELLEDILASRRLCERSSIGARISTHCLYPSADPVFVHVGAWGDGFRVSDGGEAAECAAFHGRDESAISIGLASAKARHSLEVEGGQLVARVPSQDWLPAAINAVANGAAHAASVAVEHLSKKTERSLKSRIFAALDRTVPDKLIAREYEYRGKSGKLWHLDYAITVPERPILIKAVTPHHNSIASTYTTFGDVNGESNWRYCVFQRRPADDDAALLRQVGELVPLRALSSGVSAALQ